MMDEIVEDLYVAALEVIGDYEQYGPVLQFDEDGEYGPDTALGMLRKAVGEFEQKKGIIIERVKDGRRKSTN